MKKNVWTDPIVEEVRHARETLAARFDFDIDAIVRNARTRQGKSGHKVVSMKPKQPQEFEFAEKK